MSKHRDLNRLDVLPASFLDALQEVISGAFFNFRLEQHAADGIRCVASAEDPVGVVIDGRWRYVTANVTATHPGGSAGIHSVYVTASDNSFSETPTPDTDNTVYAFALEIRTSGTPSTALFRKIADVKWNGTAIVDIDGTLHGEGDKHYIGEVIDFTGPESNIPINTVPADGRSIATATYPAYNARVGNAWNTQWGAADPGAGNVRVIDARGSVLAGKENMGGSTPSPSRIAAGTVLAFSTGQEAVTLSIAQMPTHQHGAGAHTHAITAESPGTGGVSVGHTHTTTLERFQPGEGLVALNGSFYVNTVVLVDPTGGADFTPTSNAQSVDHSHTVNSHSHGGATQGASISPVIANEGGGGSHTNLQPTVIVNKVVKIA